MICKSCGTEIADKALICYRCGAPTSGPIAPVRRAPRRSAFDTVLTVIALLLLVAAALFLGFAGRANFPPAVAYAVAAAAAVVVILRLVRRRIR
jgi:hypothetical protein